MRIVEYENEEFTYGVDLEKIKDYKYYKKYSESFPSPIIEIFFIGGEDRIFSKGDAIGLHELLLKCA